MTQAVSRQPLTAEARVRSRPSPCIICGGQSGTGTGFSSSTSVLPCKFHSTGAPLQGKTKKKTNHLHHRVAQKPQGCDASVASAAVPFIKKGEGKCIKLFTISLFPQSALVPHITSLKMFSQFRQTRLVTCRSLHGPTTSNTVTCRSLHGPTTSNTVTSPRRYVLSR